LAGEFRLVLTKDLEIISGRYIFWTLDEENDFIRFNQLSETKIYLQGLRNKSTTALFNIFGIYARASKTYSCVS